MNQKMSCFAEHGRCPAGPGRTVPAPAIHIHEEGHAETRTALCAARKHAFLPPDVLRKLPQSGNVSPGFLLIGDAASSWLTARCQEIIGGWFPGKRAAGIHRNPGCTPRETGAAFRIVLLIVIQKESLRPESFLRKPVLHGRCSRLAARIFSLRHTLLFSCIPQRCCLPSEKIRKFSKMGKKVLTAVRFIVILLLT